MPTAERTAKVRWEGDLTEGQGTLTAESSQILIGVPVTWASRVEQADGRTSPEELLAAAHAACFAMALSNTLAGYGSPPESLDITATATLNPKEGGGVQVSTMDLVVRARVSGMDEDKFQEVAREAEQGCPISNAIRGNVDIRLDATLETG